MSIRNFLMWFMSKETRAAAETESRRWGFVCESCGQRSSIWDIGGLRTKAAGAPVRLVKCPKCGRKGMHAITCQADGSSS